MSELQMLEMPVQDFFVTHIGRVERVGTSCVRLYACVVRGQYLEPVYSAVWPVEYLATRTAFVKILGPLRGERTEH